MPTKFNKISFYILIELNDLINSDHIISIVFSVLVDFVVHLCETIDHLVVLVAHLVVLVVHLVDHLVVGLVGHLVVDLLVVLLFEQPELKHLVGVEGNLV